MRFESTSLPGVFVIDCDFVTDERGGFARAWSRLEFERQGLSIEINECSISVNRLKGTLRGMHYQVSPHEEVKVVRATRGSIYDVALDLREHSPTYRQWCGVELSSDSHRMLYVPKGCAHGFQTLADDTEVFYQISASYEPDAGRGVRWDDPAFGIAWPLPVAAIHPRDAAYPLVSTSKMGT